MNKILFAILLSILSVQISNAQWVKISNGMGDIIVNSLAAGGNNIFAGTPTFTDRGVFLSTNNGTNWTHTSLNNELIYSLAVNGNDVFAGTGNPNNGAYLSTNNGTNWIQTSLNNKGVQALTINGNNIFAGTVDSGVWISTNNGTNWTQTSLNREIQSMAVSGGNILAGTGDAGVWKSTNNGANWTQPLTNFLVWALTVSGNNVFAGTQTYGVFRSTDNGTLWSQTTLNSQTNVWSLAASGNNIFAGTNGNGVYVSNDNGGNWTQRNEGLANLTILSLCVFNGYIYAGSYGSSVWRRPIAEVIGILPISNEIPNTFSLSQNYPNPFNPATSIEFAIPRSSFVKLSIYDMLGREVETLVNENLNAGIYKADWNAVNYTSGVYLYKLISADYSETKRMILIK